MKLPALWRKKRGSKFTGSYHVTVDGTDVNLRTSDANEAHERRNQAVRSGRRNFADEIDEAAAAADGNVQGGPGPDGAHNPVAGGSTPPPATSQAAPPAPPAPAPAVEQRAPAALPAMSDEDLRAEAEATNAAAAEAADAPAGDGAAPPVPPEVLDQLLTNGALVIVELQLQLQAWAIKKSLKKVAGEIPDDSPMRKLAADAWAAQLKVWIPADQMLPPWALALILPAMCIPVQIATATPIPKEDAAPEGAPEAQEAA